MPRFSDEKGEDKPSLNFADPQDVFVTRLDCITVYHIGEGEWKSNIEVDNIHKLNGKYT